MRSKSRKIKVSSHGPEAELKLHGRGGYYFYCPGFILNSYRSTCIYFVKYCAQSFLSNLNTSLVYLEKKKHKQGTYSLVNAPTRQIYKKGTNGGVLRKGVNFSSNNIVRVESLSTDNYDYFDNYI